MTEGSFKALKISIVIRTYNEATYLGELLEAIHGQVLGENLLEVVIVDSGSTDGTLEIAKSYSAKIVHINKSEFTFGRSLNIGCRSASGDIFILISGHCVPTNSVWLMNLVRPLADGVAVCSYGKQIGRDTSKFSEEQLFLKYFPSYSKIVQEGFFCNNANAAIRRDAWEKFGYDEGLTGLEDMYLARQICEDGGKIAYIADSVVYHIHNESWKQVRIRYEREALALQRILPNVHFGAIDFLLYVTVAIAGDLRAAARQRILGKEIKGIFLFRIMQYLGTLKGARRHRIVSEAIKHSYFYPKDLEKDKYVKKESSGVAAHES